MSYRYPLLPRLLVEARAYAVESKEHTVTYEGWDASRFMERATLGKFAQLWLAEFCRLNEISHKADRSSPYEPDKQDLHIHGISVDCKASNMVSMWPQVSVNCDVNPVDAYFFFNISKNMDYIKPLGGLSHSQFIGWRVHVAKGQKIPETNLTQSYSQGSYFVDPKKLLSLDGFLSGAESRAQKSKEAAA